MSKQQNSLKVSTAVETNDGPQKVKQRVSSSPKKRAAKIMENSTLHTEEIRTKVTSSNDPVIQTHQPHEPSSFVAVTLRPWPFPTGIGRL